MPTEWRSVHRAERPRRRSGVTGAVLGVLVWLLLCAWLIGLALFAAHLLGYF
jgi:hypothetical protein